MLTTHMDPQLTGSDVVTTGDGHLLRREMQNIRKTLKPIDMKKIEKYVVFKYEDEFGFHYMVIDKLPGEEPTYMEPTSSEKKKINPVGFHYTMMDELPREEPTHPKTLTFEKKINPNCTPGAITRQPFSEDGKLAYVLSSKFVPVAGWWPNKGDVLEWQEGTRVYRATKELKKEEEDLKLEKAIEPIREAYSRLSPSGRSTFIAQMVYLLTK